MRAGSGPSERTRCYFVFNSTSPSRCFSNEIAPRGLLRSGGKTGKIPALKCNKQWEQNSVGFINYCLYTLINKNNSKIPNKHRAVISLWCNTLWLWPYIHMVQISTCIPQLLNKNSSLYLTYGILVYKNVSNSIMSSLIRCVWYDIMNVTLQYSWQYFNSQALGHISHHVVFKADSKGWVANGWSLGILLPIIQI